VLRHNFITVDKEGKKIRGSVEKKQKYNETRAISSSRKDGRNNKNDPKKKKRIGKNRTKERNKTCNLCQGTREKKDSKEGEMKKGASNQGIQKRGKTQGSRGGGKAAQ